VVSVTYIKKNWWWIIKRTDDIFKKGFSLYARTLKVFSCLIFIPSSSLSSDDSRGDLFASASHDQTVGLCRLARGEEGEEENDNISPAGAGSIVVVHRCKGHTESVEDLDVCPDKSKVRLRSSLLT